MVKKAKPRYTPKKESILRAYCKAVKGLGSDSRMCSDSVSAGFVLEPYRRGVPRKGFQIFVKLCRFDEALLRSQPMSGGLLENSSAVR